MSTPILYRSSDTSAPVLTGTAGDLVNLLDKCLVSGYGSKSAAGWTKPFTATNSAVFRQGAGNQFYLDVNDNGASTGLTGASGKEAAIRGYETMSAVGTGTGPFPTVVQIAAATANWRKSATADATQRGWWVVADDRTFIVGILDGDIAGRYKLYYFGDFYSLKAGDGYRTALTVRNAANSVTDTGCLFGQNSYSSSVTGTATGVYAARAYTGSGASVSVGFLIVGSILEQNGSLLLQPDGNLYLARPLMGETSVLRGWWRGVYAILLPTGVTDGDTFTGVGDFAGRNFVVVKGIGGTAAVAVELSAWDTSS